MRHQSGRQPPRDGRYREAHRQNKAAKRGRADRVASLPTASGGIARAAYFRAMNAGLDVNAFLKNASLTRSQIRKKDARIPVRSQIRFLNEIAEGLGDEFLGFEL